MTATPRRRILGLALRIGAWTAPAAAAFLLWWRWDAVREVLQRAPAGAATAVATEQRALARRVAAVDEALGALRSLAWIEPAPPLPAGAGDPSSRPTGRPSEPGPLLARPLRIAIPSNGAGVALVLANGGLQAAPGSPLARRGVMLELTPLDDSPLLWRRLQAGELDGAVTTVDAWAYGSSAVVPEVNPAAPTGGPGAASVLFLGFSRGADGVVVGAAPASTRPLRNAGDLAGRRIAVAPFTPPHFLLVAEMTRLPAGDQLGALDHLVLADDASQALGLLLADQAEAAAVSEPSLSRTIGQGSGSTRLVLTTRDDATLVAETLVVRKDVLARAPAAIEQLCEAVFEAGAHIAQERAASAIRLAAALGIRSHAASALITERSFASLADDWEFYGLAGGPSRYDAIYSTARIVWDLPPIGAAAVAATRAASVLRAVARSRSGAQVAGAKSR